MPYFNGHLHALHLFRFGDTLTALDFSGSGCRGVAFAGRIAGPGKANLQAPWLGFTGVFVVSIMLTLLVFIGEGVRDALDPRKTFA